MLLVDTCDLELVLYYFGWLPLCRGYYTESVHFQITHDIYSVKYIVITKLILNIQDNLNLTWQSGDFVQEIPFCLFLSSPQRHQELETFLNDPKVSVKA